MNSIIKAEVLRQQAEKLLKTNPAKTDLSLSESEIRKLINEMEVHQIELEIQNKELELQNTELRLAKKQILEESEKYYNLTRCAIENK